nr:immunoglobulin heavy chain junction region [Macaca mulatta]MOV39558.1 immunoglobulin heavy chain junction region [Macaca mulatta]MOV40265.1 immunoglobulin heavy chain junction region [Macaca mulatta]MOV40641.1 immunoglobulin heavy chain junction region [Macaca mulatta]MOV40763.1 immunoglobulin heavy chain junction region [Macaca mulatta]
CVGDEYGSGFSYW